MNTPFNLFDLITPSVIKTAKPSIQLKLEENKVNNNNKMNMTTEHTK